MKKIYAGHLLAAVILDSAQEVKIVTDALRFYHERVNWSSVDPMREVCSTLYAELTAPAPDWEPEPEISVNVKPK